MSTLGDYPLIRYQAAAKAAFSTSSTAKTKAGELAGLVQKEMDMICREDNTFPPPNLFKRTILIIVDRAIDVIAPLLHEFTYQAMSADLVGLSEGRYKEDSGKDVLMDESDLLWDELRGRHIADVLQIVPEKVKKFTEENMAAKFELGYSLV